MTNLLIGIGIGIAASTIGWKFLTLIFGRLFAATKKTSKKW